MDRVRENTPDRINEKIDDKARQSVENYKHANEAKLSHRIQELNKEWDLERALATTASTLTLTGLALSQTVNRRWLILPGVVAAFLLQHSLQGWCPPLPVFRALKFRNRREIDREKYALKLLRGDFDKISENTPAREILRAV